MWYSTISKSYNELYKEEQLKKVKLILENINIPREYLLLDVGCGTGVSLQKFQCNKIGIDLEIELLKQAQKPVICAIAEALPFKDKSFDIITSITAIHNFKDFIKGLMEIKRIGKDNFILSVLKKANKKDEIIKTIKKLFQIKKELIEEKDEIFIARK